MHEQVRFWRQLNISTIRMCLNIMSLRMMILNVHAMILRTLIQHTFLQILFRKCRILYLHWISRWHRRVDLVTSLLTSLPRTLPILNHAMHLLSTRLDFHLLLLRIQYKNSQLNKRIWNRLLFCQRQLLLLIQIILLLIQHTYYKLTCLMMLILILNLLWQLSQFLGNQKPLLFRNREFPLSLLIYYLSIFLKVNEIEGLLIDELFSLRKRLGIHMLFFM